MNAPVPRDLFSPGRGAPPPHLAGREEELKKLGKEIPKAGGKPPARDVVLIGPRGNGKTVLLGEFARRCREAGADVKKITPARLGDKAALVAWLLAKPTLREAAEGVDPDSLLSKFPPAFKGIAESIGNWTQKVKTLGVPGVIGIEFQRMNAADRKQTLLHLDSLLLEACRERPRVALIDEAHTLDPEVAGLLLNVAQDVSEAGAPFLLVLAGTPQLPETLRSANASFWSRCAKIGVGRLSDAAAREALEKPLAEHGMLFNPEALAAVVEESQRYPFFVQLWGEALCEALSEAGAPEGERMIGLSTVEAARPRFRSEKNGYYGDRYVEIEQRGLLPAAEAVAQLFVARGGDVRLLSKTIKRVLQDAGAAESDSAAFRATMALYDLGYLWQHPGRTRYEPGIPNLMSHVIEQGEGSDPEPVADTAPGP